MGVRFLREARVPLGERCGSVLLNLYQHGVLGASRRKQIAAALFQCYGSHGRHGSVAYVIVFVSRDTRITQTPPIDTIAARLESQELDSARHLIWRQQVIDQHQIAKHLSDPHGPLLTIRDAGVGNPVSMEPEEVRVMRHQDASRRSSKGELRCIISAEQS